jgi:hypothetical protein
MRFIKMLGLAMVAAVAAMALVGAGSASATSTALCSAHPEGETCKAGTALTGLQKIDGLQILGAGVLTTSLGNIQCLNGHIKATIPNATLVTGSSLLGKINVFTYLECESKLTGCSGKTALITTTVEPEFHLLYTELNLGTLTVLKPSTTVEILNCPLVGTIKCKFAENDTVTGTVHNLHDEGAGLKILPVALFKAAPITGPGGGLCPKSGTLTTAFELKYLETATIEKPVFIAK